MAFTFTGTRNRFSGSLAGNALRIFSANIAVQLVSFATLPFFARVYLPADYGTWGVFMFVSGFIAVISCLRLEMAVMIPKDDDEAKKIVLNAGTINLMIFCSLLLIMMVGGNYIAAWLKMNYLLLLLIPLHAFSTAFNNLMVQWISRKKLFNELMKVRVAQSLLNILLSFIFGWMLNMGAAGLILSTVLSVLLVNIILSVKHSIPLIAVNRNGLSTSKEHFSKYNSFIRYSTPLALLNYGTGNILYYILNSGYGTLVTGYYTNAVRIIQAPFSMISSSLSSVFYQQFSRTHNKLLLFVKAFTALVIIYTMLLLPFIFYGDEIITWYLGKTWQPVAQYIKFLSAFMIFSFSMSSISTVFSFFQKDRLVLIWQILYLIVTISIFVAFKNKLELSMWSYSLSGAIAYFILFLAGIYLIKTETRDEVAA